MNKKNNVQVMKKRYKKLFYDKYVKTIIRAKPTWTSCQIRSLNYVTGITQLKIKRIINIFLKKNVLTFFKSVIQVIKLETLNLENSQSSILKTKNIK